MEYDVTSMEALRAAASDIIATKKRTYDPKNGAAILGLNGELGTGKTAFVQTIAALLGVQEHVASPTFVVQQTYATTDSVFQTLVHVDAYRIEDPEELRVLNFDSVLTQENTLVSIEWVTRVRSILPQTIQELTFTLTDTRRILKT